MSKARAQYDKIAESFAESGVVTGQMFGKPSLKFGGNAFAAFHQESMAFKLKGAAHAAALILQGSVLWDPSGKGRPMKEWVFVGEEHASNWPKLTLQAQQYVATLPVK